MKKLARIVRDLQEEGGITENSIHNASVLMAQRGKPDQLDFKADQKQGEYIVIATWEKEPRFVFTFTGFAWGYGGTGPNALDLFLADCGCKLTWRTLPLDDFGKTDCSWRKDGKFTA